MFTYQYAQPPEYHFSLDSIQFAEFVASELKKDNNLDTLRVLDLCAGCGVIGFQIAWFIREIKHIDFVEVQSIYTDYFQQNISIVNRSELNLNWHLLNYDDLQDNQWKNKYDLIVSNPPYFQPQHGMLSSSEFKNRCRFYLDSTYENFIFAIINSLAKNGKAYFLLRSLQQHGINLLDQTKALLPPHLTLQKITQIRGTDVIKIFSKE